MPNHIKNRLILNGPKLDVASCIDAYSTFFPSKPDTAYDDSIIYICEQTGEAGWLKDGVFTRRNCLDLTEVPDRFKVKMTDEFTRFPDFAKVIPPPDHPAYRDEPNQQAVRDSPYHWYNWNINNWGTKCNSYSHTKEGDNIYFFETAWSSVPKIIAVMSLAFPFVSFQYDYADEDTGSNTGSFTFLAGEMTGSVITNGSIEAYDKAFELRPDRKENFILVDGEYQYKDEE